MRKTAKINKRYTDQQVIDMLRNAAMWRDELREAAAERGYDGLSVVPIADVLTWLLSKFHRDYPSS